MATKRMNKCVIPSCTLELRRKEENLSNHTFPKSKTLEIQRQRWVKIVREARHDDDWEPSESSIICSRHFERTCFSFSLNNKRLLLNANPTLHLCAEETDSPAGCDVQPSTSHVIHISIGSEERMEERDETFVEAGSIKGCSTSSTCEESSASVDIKISHEEIVQTQDSDCLPADIPDNTEAVFQDVVDVKCPSCSFNFQIPQNKHDEQGGSNWEDCSSSESEMGELPEKRAKFAKISRKRLFQGSNDSIQGSSLISPEQGSSFKPFSNAFVVTPRSRKRVRQEHNYADSPNRAADELIKLKSELEKLKKAHKNLQNKYNRKEKSEASLREKLAATKFLTGGQLNNLEDQFPSFFKTLVASERKAANLKGKTGMSYDDEMKKFAATLHFYSPRAYNFAREYITLPHPNTISSWMKSSDCGPGFNVDVLKRLGEVRKNDATNTMTDVMMTIDEMAIHKDLVWDPTQHKYIGHIDYGVDVDQAEDAPLATNALVCMIASISGGWKVPIGYVFTNKTDGLTQKTFVDQAFNLLEEQGFNVHSLTTDGNSANVSTFEAYGVVEPRPGLTAIEYEDIDYFFANPANESKTVCVIYDIVHMMKLWRNLIGQCGQIMMEDGSIVDWKYIKLVLELQENEKIRAANKLGRYHIYFEKHKMNAKLSVQALSKSVADTIVFCREDLKLPSFEGSKGTSDFLYLLDRVFDILNSRHPGQKGNKAPLSKRNLRFNTEFLKNFCQIVLKMKYTEVRNYENGKVTKTVKYLTQSGRKRAALGMIISIKSIIKVSEHLLNRAELPFRYVMTYRFSQDLVELFFNKVRGRLGRNNNPNVFEFRNVMKKIWHQNLLKSSNTGNCIAQMEEGQVPGGLLPLKPRSREIVPLDESEFVGLDLSYLMEQQNSSPFYKNCLTYIAGNVVRVVGTKINCEKCAEALLHHELDPLEDPLKLLIRRKDRGGLMTPCRSVFRIVEIADGIWRKMLAESGGRANHKNLDIKIANMVTKKCIGINLFPHLTSHVLDFDPLDTESHLCKLIRNVVLHFLRIRLFDYGKRYMKNQEISTRHTLTKLTLFKNQ